MKNVMIPYTVTLLSDTCCGNGTGNGSDVDTKACFDSWGLPMIPAKRLRGLLRENALLLGEKYGDDAVEDLFGNSGRASRLIVEDARYPDAEAVGSALKKDYPVSEIAEAFTVKRTRTAVDAKTGVAAQTSLRTIETVRAGTVLIGAVQIENGSEADESLIRDAFRLLRHIGLNKHRGLGEVRCETGETREVKPFEAPSEFTSAGPLCSCTYTLTLRQDVTLMLNSPMRNPTCIPGAALQGAFAKAFTDKPYFDRLFFSDLCFGPAYVTDGTRQFYPVPLSCVAVKNQTQTVYDLADGYEMDEKLQYVPVNGYACSEGGQLLFRPVRSGTDYHINKGNSNAGSKTFFNVERLSGGQSFRGVIWGSRTALELLIKAAAAQDNVIRVGGSLSAQYGKCEIRMDEPVEYRQAGFSSGDELVVTLRSDTVVMDRNGVNSADVSDLVDSLAGEGALELCTGVDGKPLVFVKTVMTGGYNAAWGMPKPQRIAFAAGSTLVVRCLRDDVAIPPYIGIGTDEGFGCVGCRRKDPGAASLQRVSLRESDAEDPSGSVPTAVEEVRKNIIRSRARRKVILAAAKAAEKADSQYSEASKSAVMRIMTLFAGMKRERTPEAVCDEADGAFKKNPALGGIMKTCIDGYDNSVIEVKDTAMFEVYLRAFIGRFKELRHDEPTDGKEAEA